MRIDVIATDDSTTPQARAYAEYRLFAALARHARVIRTARVELARGERHGGASGVSCAVQLTLIPSGFARARARGSHTFCAIDRAAERIRDLMSRRAPASISS
jgi:hypothetical protein